MSAVADTHLDAATGDRLARRNAMILAVAQALAGGNNVVHDRDWRHRRRHARAQSAGSRPFQSPSTCSACGWARCRWVGCPQLRPADLVLHWHRIRRAHRARLLRGGDHWRRSSYSALRRCSAELYAVCAPVLPFCGGRHGERPVPSEGDFLGSWSAASSPASSGRSSSSAPRISGNLICSPARTLPSRRLRWCQPRC